MDQHDGVVQEIWRHLFSEAVQEYHAGNQRLEIHQETARQEKYTLQQPAAISRCGFDHSWRPRLDDAVRADLADHAEAHPPDFYGTQLRKGALEGPGSRSEPDDARFPHETRGSYAPSEKVQQQCYHVIGCVFLSSHRPRLNGLLVFGFERRPSMMST